MFALAAPLHPPEYVERDAFIKAMRGVASSVTVVTTDGAAGRHGATVSAFCSLSADPPSVLICLKADSRIARCVATNGCFCVNVLPAAETALADRFAGRHDATFGDRFAGLDWFTGEELPVFRGATAFECQLVRDTAFGTHRIMIGQPIELWEGATEPLAWLDGGYHRVVPQD